MMSQYTDLHQVVLEEKKGEIILKRIIDWHLKYYESQLEQSSHTTDELDNADIFKY